MAQAKRKNTTKPSRAPASRTTAQICKDALPRMECIIETLATYGIAEGWHESWESGPMPKRATEVMAYLRGLAAGKRENAAQEDKVNAFIKDCGQSWDWIYAGNVRGMICDGARAKVDMVPRQKVKDVASEICDLEDSVLCARNLAMAARMLASSDDMPKDPGLALESVAGMLVEKLDALAETRTRIWQLARAAEGEGTGGLASQCA